MSQSNKDTIPSWRKGGVRFLLVIALMSPGVSSEPSGACTSAIIGSRASATGRPLLWKNRDTSNVDNIVEYIPASAEGEIPFVGLFNANDKRLEQCWIGMNKEGFAVMNTASYNIKDDDVPASMMDREGYVMTLALKSCRTVDDFGKLLDKLPRPIGVEANFGVIDAEGNGAFFETNNDSYKRYDLKEARDGVLIRSNYSHGGRPDEGYGFIRESNAEKLLAPYVASHSVSPEILTEKVSRSFYHSLFDRDFAVADGERWVIDQDFIPRYKSSATVVIEGIEPEKSGKKNPGEDYVMWTALGYPPCAETYPVLCAPDGVDLSLQGLEADHHSKMSDLAKKRRDEVFPFHKGNGDKYIDMRRLVNSEGTGYLQIIPRQNLERYAKFRKNNNKK